MLLENATLPACAYYAHAGICTRKYCKVVLALSRKQGQACLQGAGYGLIAGFGAFFSLLTIALVYADYKARGKLIPCACLLN